MVARWWLLGFLLVGTQHCLLASQHHSYQGLLSSLRFFSSSLVICFFFLAIFPLGSRSPQLHLSSRPSSLFIFLQS